MYPSISFHTYAYIHPRTTARTHSRTHARTHQVTYCCRSHDFILFHLFYFLKISRLHDILKSQDLSNFRTKMERNTNSRHACVTGPPSTFDDIAMKVFVFISYVVKHYDLISCFKMYVSLLDLRYNNIIYP